MKTIKRIITCIHILCKKKKMNQYHLVCKAMENKNSNTKINLFILFFFFLDLFYEK